MTGTTIRTAAALMWTLTAAPLVPAVSRAQVVAPPAADLLARRYREGETFRYRMTASNRGPSDTVTYSLTADVTVQKDTDGRFFEEVAWHDGQRVIIGESSIDFDVTLKGIDRTAETATLLIRHVPSTPPQVKIPSEWMLPPVADTPNNWVQVERTGASNFTASVGQETFDVTITLSLTDGHVMSAILDNPVQVRERECENEALTVCGGPIRYEIRRHMEITSAR